jgi:hypothetical protein
MHGTGVENLRHNLCHLLGFDPRDEQIRAINLRYEPYMAQKNIDGVELRQLSKCT